jgi:hypothetical protein
VKPILSTQIQLYVDGDQLSGWIASYSQGRAGQSSRLMVVNLRVEEANGGYLVLLNSVDGSIYCDFWVETLDEAKEICLNDYGFAF